MYIWSLKRNMDPNGRIIKHKARLCVHGGMQKWELNYWYNYSPVDNLMSAIAILTLNILIEIHTKSVDFVLD